MENWSFIPLRLCASFMLAVMTRLLSILIVMILGWANVCSAQLQFSYNSVGNSFADNGLQIATDNWANEFEDEITINIDFSFDNIGAGSLAATASNTGRHSYSEFWNAIGNDVTSNDDEIMWNGMPTGTSFSVYINRTNEASGMFGATPYVDDDGGANNSNVTLTTANAKALGLRSARDGVTDAAIVFNSSFAWDFDPTDGIDDGALDFVGIATHEIGHALGFESGIDELDANGFGLHSDNDFDFVTSIDFLRFSSESENAGADIDWTADNRAKYFSIDGGLSKELDGSDHWSTGVVHGDGEQNSHWKEGQQIGVLAPTTGFGLANSISATDLQAFDVIGYNRTGSSSFTAVPEPASLFLGFVVLGGMLRRRRVV